MNLSISSQMRFPAEELVEEDVPSEADTVPEVLDMSISYNGSTIDRDLVSGSFVFTAGGDTEVADYTATIALSDDAVFTPHHTQRWGSLCGGSRRWYGHSEIQPDRGRRGYQR